MKKCPKCACTAIDSGRILSAGRIYYKSDSLKRRLASGTCTTYVCTACGFCETYINAEYLNKIKSK
ncbi:MAG: hypothetical protein ABII79_00190 [bacterium]